MHTQPAGHSLTPTTPARSSRSTREHPATIAWGHARPEGMRIHMISRALLLHGTARQSSRRPRGRGRVHESGHLQHGDAVAPPVRLPVGGRGVFVGWGLLYKNSRNGLQLDHRSANDDRRSTGDFVGIRVRAAIVGRHCTRRSPLPQLALSWWRYCPRIAADTQRLATALTLRIGVRVARHAGSTEHLAPHAGLGRVGCFLHVSQF
jgi:hypothetical protein